MKNFRFYYVSLSDGDASMRIRVISSSVFDDTYSEKTNFSEIKPYSTLNFVVSGEVSVNNQTIRAGQAYYEDTYPKENYVAILSRGTVLLSFSFDGIHHKKLMSDLNIKSNLSPYPADVYDFDEIMAIYNELADMHRIDAPTDPPQMLSQINAKKYFYRALYCLENESIMQLDTARRKLLVDAETYMRKHFNKAITIEDVSCHLSVDRRYLYKLFKKYSGISPKQYLNNVRVAHASELLSNSDLSVTMIAADVGYDDPLQFSAFFKKQTGYSPKKYRELC